MSAFEFRHNIQDKIPNYFENFFSSEKEHILLPIREALQQCETSEYKFFYVFDMFCFGFVLIHFQHHLNNTMH